VAAVSLSLAPQIEAKIREKIDTGRYADENEVVQVALDLLDERDRRAYLRDALARAEEQIARGEGVLYTPELREEIRQAARRKLQEGQTPNSDVVP
jgi:putative addiction module CopG family antidote